MSPHSESLSAYRRLVARSYDSLHGAGFGRPISYDEPALAPDGRRLIVSASVLDDLAGLGRTELWWINLDGTPGRRLPTPGTCDRHAHWSPCGRWLAYLSVVGGLERLFVAPSESLEAGSPVVMPPGTIEYLAWSASGDALLAGVAAPGAELSGMEGARATAFEDDAPPWLPRTTSESRTHLWRTLWTIPMNTRTPRLLSRPGYNVWYGAWCGESHIAVPASDDPLEAAWYTSRVDLIDAADGSVRPLYRPELQIGAMAGSTDGRRLALVEGPASDRLVVAGAVRIVDLESGALRALRPARVDVTSIVWRSTERLTFAGHRDFATVSGDIDVRSGEALGLLTDEARHSGFWMPTALPYGRDQLLRITQSFASETTVTLHGGRDPRSIAAPAHPAAERVRDLVGEVRALRWLAPDGLEIQGWFIEPRAKGPFPIATEIHGGPVWMNRNSWLGHMPLLLTLLAAGYAIFLPNPRGSWGRGPEFMARIVGDMGGLDVGDFLAGFDHLVSTGLGRSDALCLTGSSYGGYMTNVLVTRDTRFAAAVARCPVTDWHSQHRTSNIPHFDDLFLGGRAIEGNARHWERSPVFGAKAVKTPTLQLCGLLDRCSPATQAREMYAALSENGVDTGLVTYPLEGHGLRSYPVRIDVTARILQWFDRGSRIRRDLGAPPQDRP